MNDAADLRARVARLEAQVRILRKALVYFDIRRALTQADAQVAKDALAAADALEEPNE